MNTTPTRFGTSTDAASTLRMDVRLRQPVSESYVGQRFSSSACTRSCSVTSSTHTIAPLTAPDSPVSARRLTSHTRSSKPDRGAGPCGSWSPPRRPPRRGVVEHRTVGLGHVGERIIRFGLAVQDLVEPLFAYTTDRCGRRAAARAARSRRCDATAAPAAERFVTAISSLMSTHSVSTQPNSASSSRLWFVSSSQTQLPLACV